MSCQLHCTDSLGIQKHEKMQARNRSRRWPFNPRLILASMTIMFLIYFVFLRSSGDASSSSGHPSTDEKEILKSEDAPLTPSRSTAANDVCQADSRDAETRVIGPMTI